MEAHRSTSLADISSFMNKRVSVRARAKLNCAMDRFLDEVAFKIEVIEKSGEVTSPHP